MPEGVVGGNTNEAKGLKCTFVARGLAPVPVRSTGKISEMLESLGPLRSPTGRCGDPTSPLATEKIAAIPVRSITPSAV
ncbi:hypothetical protein D3C73_1435770 [compost metagenome]